MKFFEFLAVFYWPYLPLLILTSFRKVRWRRIYAQKGMLGLVSEGLGTLAGSNVVVFFAPLYGEWSGRDIEKLLRYWGIEMWGWGFSYGEMFFHVRAEESALAQDILLNAGVELLG
jgi:hypothetical protein